MTVAGALSQQWSRGECEETAKVPGISYKELGGDPWLGGWIGCMYGDVAALTAARGQTARRMVITETCRVNRRVVRRLGAERLLLTRGALFAMRVRRQEQPEAVGEGGQHGKEQSGPVFGGSWAHTKLE